MLYNITTLPYFTALLPRYHITTLPYYHITKLPNYHILTIELRFTRIYHVLGNCGVKANHRLHPLACDQHPGNSSIFSKFGLYYINPRWRCNYEWHFASDSTRTAVFRICSAIPSSYPLLTGLWFHLLIPQLFRLEKHITVIIEPRLQHSCRSPLHTSQFPFALIILIFTATTIWQLIHHSLFNIPIFKSVTINI